MEKSEYTTFRERVLAEIQRRKISVAEAARISGVKYDVIRDMKRGQAMSTSADNAEKIASALQLNLTDIFPRTVALAGRVGAGAKVPLFDAYEKGDGPQIECPPAISSSGVVAVEIEGDSMEPVFSAGDVLFYTRHTHENVPSEAIGRRSVCEDADGNVWVKQVKRGDEPDKFHLISLNPGAQTMWNVTLKWASPIRLHWPKELVKKATN
ncbi:S24 family peptidase [Roseovarius mucosus]|uniref:S24 family peptidase n=1 Tax=Roseovarius mucosus TaxID=215743 RepID=UPI0035D0B294